MTTPEADPDDALTAAVPAEAPADAATAKPLTPRQQRFVELMLQHGNAAEAARRAGYGPVAAKHTARKLLARPQVRAALATARAAKAAPVSREAVLGELKAIAFANMLDFVTVEEDGRLALDLSTLTRVQAAGFRELTVDETWNTRTGERRRQVRVKMGPKVFALSRLLAAMDREAAEAAEAARADRRATRGIARGLPKGHRRPTPGPPPSHPRSEPSH